MKVVFVSNYFNHHQQPFCEEMYQRLGTNFTFVSTNAMSEEHKRLGYAQSKTSVYVVHAYENRQQRQKAIALINDADIVIAGAAPFMLFLKRLLQGKLLLRYSERPFKKETTRLQKLYHAIGLRLKDGLSSNVHMLCASAYAAGDYASIGMYKGRTYQWGYFPETKTYDVDALMHQKKRNTLMWCGRLIDLKHPEDAIALAQRLKKDGYNFQLKFAGTGILEDELHRLAANLSLTDCVHFLGAMTPDQVRTHMEEAGIFLFTSDRQEGWGAVLNEAMNSGCAVVASHAIGSIPFLVKHNQNGCIYESRNVDMLYHQVRDLLDQPQKQETLGRAAYQTIVADWNAKTAASRLLNLMESISALSSQVFTCETGPCSSAEPLADHWFEEYSEC